MDNFPPVDPPERRRLVDQIDPKTAAIAGTAVGVPATLYTAGLMRAGVPLRRVPQAFRGDIRSLGTHNIGGRMVQGSLGGMGSTMRSGVKGIWEGFKGGEKRVGSNVKNLYKGIFGLSARLDDLIQFGGRIGFPGLKEAPKGRLALNEWPAEARPLIKKAWLQSGTRERLKVANTVFPGGGGGVRFGNLTHKPAEFGNYLYPPTNRPRAIKKPKKFKRPIWWSISERLDDIITFDDPEGRKKSLLEKAVDIGAPSYLAGYGLYKRGQALGGSRGVIGNISEGAKAIPGDVRGIVSRSITQGSILTHPEGRSAVVHDIRSGAAKKLRSLARKVKP